MKKTKFVDITSTKHAVNHIIRDIQDPNMKPEVPKRHIKATPKSVLIKKDTKCAFCGRDNVRKTEGDKARMQVFDTKKAFAEAKMGIRPSVVQNKKQKGVEKLKSFLGKIECKRYHK